MSTLKVNQVEPVTGSAITVAGNTNLTVSGTGKVTTPKVEATDLDINGTTTLELQHNGSTKVAVTSGGATVTGTMTATAFVGDGSGLTNLTAPGVGGSSAAGNLELRSDSDNNGAGDIVFQTGTGAGSEKGRIYRANGDVRFDTDTLCVDATNNRVGIGTASPNRALHIHSSTASSIVQLTNSGTGTNNNDGLELSIATSTAYLWNYEAGDIRFGTSGAQRMTVAANGNVGIGTGSPTTALEVSGSAITANAGIAFPSTSGNANHLDYYQEGTWTPAYAMSGGTPVLPTITYSAGTTGRYVRIGNVVHLTAQILTSAGNPTSGASGNYLVITGMPFNISAHTTSGVIGYSSTSSWGLFRPTKTYGSGTILYLTADDGSHLSTSAAHNLSSKELYFSITYMIA